MLTGCFSLFFKKKKREWKKNTKTEKGNPQHNKGCCFFFLPGVGKSIKNGQAGPWSAHRTVVPYTPVWLLRAFGNDEMPKQHCVSSTLVVESMRLHNGSRHAISNSRRRWSCYWTVASNWGLWRIRGLRAPTLSTPKTFSRPSTAAAAKWFIFCFFF